MLGRYEIDEKAGVFRFHSRFPSAPGIHYRVVFRPIGTTATPYVATYSVKRDEQKATTYITHVSPTSDLLPENLLKFYIEFSTPMGRGSAYEHLRLLDAAGNPLDLPFLELGEELWDQRGQRFTLLFDPGRIKTGLKPREELGPVLEAGKSYTLVIDRDVARRRRASTKERSSQVVSCWLGRCDPSRPAHLRVEPPAADTRARWSSAFPSRSTAPCWGGCWACLKNRTRSWVRSRSARAKLRGGSFPISPGRG